MNRVQLPKNVIFLNKKEVSKLVHYSGSHIQRLENKGEFPRRLSLGPGRVVWKTEEIEQWINVKIATAAVAKINGAH